MHPSKALLVVVAGLLALNLLLPLVRPAEAQRPPEPARPAAAIPAGVDYWIFMPEGGSWPPLLLNTRTGQTGSLTLQDNTWNWRSVRILN